MGFGTTVVACAALKWRLVSVVALNSELIRESLLSSGCFPHLSMITPRLFQFTSYRVRLFLMRQVKADILCVNCKDTSDLKGSNSTPCQTASQGYQWLACSSLVLILKVRQSGTCSWTNIVYILQVCIHGRLGQAQYNICIKNLRDNYNKTSEHYKLKSIVKLNIQGCIGLSQLFSNNRNNKN